MYDNFPYLLCWSHAKTVIIHVSRMLDVSTTLNVDIASFCSLDRIEAKVSCFVST